MKSRRIAAFLLVFTLLFSAVPPPLDYVRAEGEPTSEEAGAADVAPQEPAPTEAPKPTAPPATPAPTEAPKPTDAPATPAPTEAPKPTDAPATPAPTEAPKPTDAPATPVPTEAPKPTDAPATPAPTEAPKPTEPPVTLSPTEVAKPTESPEATRIPEAMDIPESTDTPEPANSPDPTSALEPTATLCPTLSPSQSALLEELASAKRVISLGESAIWTFTCAAGAKLSYSITNAQGQAVLSGSLDGQQELSFKPADIGGYTLTLTAARNDERLQLSDTVFVSDGKLSHKLNVSQSYATANVTPITGRFSVRGGVPPYAVSVQVAVGNKRVYSSEQTLQHRGAIDISYMPTDFGKHILRVTARDASGEQVQASVQMPVAVAEKETVHTWRRLVARLEFTGDWRTDLLAVAQTQVGYEESKRNFIIDEKGNVQGYTRYGHSYGFPYDEWCAMFVIFCMKYAQIPMDTVPHSSGCRTWSERLTAVGAYEDDELTYCPQAGDLVFISRNGNNIPSHVGIVESVSDDKVCTIEGNLRGAVRRAKHERNDPIIVGYGNVATLMKLADVKPPRPDVPTARVVSITLLDDETAEATLPDGESTETASSDGGPVEAFSSDGGTVETAFPDDEAAVPLSQTMSPLK